MALNIYQRIAESLDPERMVRRFGFELYPWQRPVLLKQSKRTVMLCARQSGKSEIVAFKALHTAKYHPGCLILIIAPSKDQSKELMLKIDAKLSVDTDPLGLESDSVFEKVFANGSRIVALPGSERSVRGYSGPRIIIMDEASRVPDETSRAARPMMVGAGTELILLSTAFGKRGFFYEAWNSEYFNKIMVVPAVELVGGKVVETDKLPDAPPGAQVFFSPRHELSFLQEELASIGEYWFRQEYLCQFLDLTTSLFTQEMIQSALDWDVTPLMEEAPTDMVDSSVEALQI